MGAENPDDLLQELQAAFGRELEAALVMARMTQGQLAEAVDYDQTTVSRWKLGKDLPKLGVVPRIETALGLHRGVLLARSGFIMGDSFETAVEKLSEQGVDEGIRRSILALYEAFRSGEGR